MGRRFGVEAVRGENGIIVIVGVDGEGVELDAGLVRMFMNMSVTKGISWAYRTKKQSRLLT